LETNVVKKTSNVTLTGKGCNQLGELVGN